MKILLSRLVLLFAVLVPATAAVMAPVFTPSISAAKQAQLSAQAHPAKAQTRHAVALRFSHATRGAKAGTPRTNTAGDTHRENCSDCGPCNLCSTCGPVSSMVAALRVPLPGSDADEPLLSEPEDRRPQFEQGGQYRPPRRA